MKTVFAGRAQTSLEVGQPGHIDLPHGAPRDKAQRGVRRRGVERCQALDLLGDHPVETDAGEVDHGG